MAVIKVTRGDLLRGQNLENEKWYSFQVNNVEGPVANANKNGFNLHLTFSLIDQSEDINGKEIAYILPINGNGKSYLGMPMTQQLIAAAMGKKLSEMPKEEFEFDTDIFKGAKVDAKNVIEIYQGNPVSKLGAFLPYRSASNSTPF